MLLLLLLLASTVDGQTLHVSGQKNKNKCVCEVNSTLWSFPALQYEEVLMQVQICEGSLKNLQEQVALSSLRLPQIQSRMANVTSRLEPFQYLHYKGLYNVLSLQLLGEKLNQLETNIGAVHSQLNNAQTQKFSKELGELRTSIDRMQTSDTVNMKIVTDKLRYLKNSVESCKTIPKDFKGTHSYCRNTLMTNISEPITTKISPYGKSYTSGSWGRQAQSDTDSQQNSYWVIALISGHIHGNTLRVYQTYEDFMAAAKHRDYTVAPSYSHTNAIEGPSGILYGEALYYHCYRSADICRYDLITNTVQRVTLPDSGVGFNNKFPYCYYDCRLNSDIDLEADETGLWVIYATVGNHGNLVVSRLVWDTEAKTLNVTQTWETRLFKKAVSNAFMVCGVMYATRYVDEYREEVFYAFDTATGKEKNTLALPLEKVAKGVASLSYNPTNKQIYMYNDGYLLAYQAQF
ncbi:olfactomedin-like isoform X2 [Parambassis ranga]|uniref:Olfactomedin-like isoform X2 n=1 Tax=Parambassis ranga TaxID=210632 RepID=A0A6P7KI82_9TELE|nr:olfactomedin-like isoform X2 [Parambassis ranga]